MDDFFEDGEFLCIMFEPESGGFSKIAKHVGQALGLVHTGAVDKFEADVCSEGLKFVDCPLSDE